MSLLVVRCPLRISLGGGGSDLPAYADEYGGRTITMAINQYVYVTTNWHTWFSHSNVEKGVGLGGSAAYRVAMQASYWAKCGPMSQADLAFDALHADEVLTERRLGGQDHYACALGSIQDIYHGKSGIYALPNYEREVKFPTGLYLFNLGETRTAQTYLTKQEDRCKEDVSLMHKIRKLADMADILLKSGGSLGPLFDEQMRAKTAMTGPPTERVSELLEHGRKWATGGKLVGAGGTGYLLFESPYPHMAEKLIETMSNFGAPQLTFRPDLEGVKVVYKEG